MESTDTTATTPATQEALVQQIQTGATELQAEEYKDLGEYVAHIDPVKVDKKIVPTASYGHRIRVAKLFDSHEEFMYKIITVAGWARTVRAGGKDFAFIEINDGSSLKNLQVSINKILKA